MSLSTSIWLLLGYQLISLRPNPTFQVGVCIEQGCSWGSEYHYHKHHGDVCEWKLQTSEDAVGRGGSWGVPGTSPPQTLHPRGPQKAARAPSLRRLPWSHPSLLWLLFLLLFREGIRSLSSAATQGSPSPPSIRTPAQPPQAHSCRLLHRSFQSTKRERAAGEGPGTEGSSRLQRRLSVEILQNHQELQIGLGKTEKPNFTSSPTCVSKASLCPSVW